MALLHLPDEILTDIAERTKWSLEFRLTCKTIHGCYDCAKFKQFQCVPKFYFECNRAWETVFQIDDARCETPKAKFIPLELPIQFSPIFKSRPDEIIEGHRHRIQIPTLAHLSETTGVQEWDKHQAIHSMQLMGDISSIDEIILVYGNTFITTMDCPFINGMKRNDDGSLTIFSCSMPIVYFYVAHHQLSVDIECYRKPSMPFQLRVEWSEITNVTGPEKSEINIIGHHLRSKRYTYPERAVAWAFKFAPAIIDKVESILYEGPGTTEPIEIPMKYHGRLAHCAKFIYPLDPNNFIVIPHEKEIGENGCRRRIRTTRPHPPVIEREILRHYPIQFRYTLKGHKKRYTLEDKYVYFLQENLARYISGGSVTIQEPFSY